VSVSGGAAKAKEFRLKCPRPGGDVEREKKNAVAKGCEEERTEGLEAGWRKLVGEVCKSRESLNEFPEGRNQSQE